MASFLQSGMADNLQEAYALAVQPYQQADAVKKAQRAAPVKSSTGAIPRGASEPKGLDAILRANKDRHHFAED